MSRSRRILCFFYAAISVIALVACWRQNIAFMSETGLDLLSGLIAFWPALLANHATTSITLDIFLFGLAAYIWMVVEARRLEIPYVWLYMILALPIAISVMFPLFLIARERRLAQIEGDRSEVTISTLDRVGLAAFGLPIVIAALLSLAW
jgi:hypothetical protein